MTSPVNPVKADIGDDGDFQDRAPKRLMGDRRRDGRGNKLLQGHHGQRIDRARTQPDQGGSAKDMQQVQIPFLAKNLLLGNKGGGPLKRYEQNAGKDETRGQFH